MSKTECFAEWIIIDRRLVKSAVTPQTSHRRLRKARQKHALPGQDLENATANHGNKFAKPTIFLVSMSNPPITIRLGAMDDPMIAIQSMGEESSSTSSIQSDSSVSDMSEHISQCRRSVGENSPTPLLFMSSAVASAVPTGEFLVTTPMTESEDTSNIVVVESAELRTQHFLTDHGSEIQTKTNDNSFQQWSGNCTPETTSDRNAALVDVPNSPIFYGSISSGREEMSSKVETDRKVSDHLWTDLPVFDMKMMLDQTEVHFVDPSIVASPEIDERPSIVDVASSEIDERRCRELLQRAPEKNESEIYFSTFVSRDRQQTVDFRAYRARAAVLPKRSHSPMPDPLILAAATNSR